MAKFHILRNKTMAVSHVLKITLDIKVNPAIINFHIDILLEC